MNRLALTVLCGSLLLAATPRIVPAQVAGSISLGTAPDELKVVALGWSVKKQILGRSVYNDSGKKIGTVEDLIITPDKFASFGIVGVGGFLGLGKHDVAIPVSQFTVSGKKLTLPGATKDALKALPAFKYAK